MKLNNKLSAILIILLLLFLIMLNFINEPMETNEKNKEKFEDNIDIIKPVGQGTGVDVDLQVTSDDIKLSYDETYPEKYSYFILDDISGMITISNLGTTQANQILLVIYLEQNKIRTELTRDIILQVGSGGSRNIQFSSIIPFGIEPGDYRFLVSITDDTGFDLNFEDNEAYGDKEITILPILEISTTQSFSYQDNEIEINAKIVNNGIQNLNVTLNFSYYLSTENESKSIPVATTNLDVEPYIIIKKPALTSLKWIIPKDLPLGRYVFLMEITNASDPDYINASATASFDLIESPDTSKTPTYLQLWFIIGLIALIIFFLTIILSLIGVIPQDRLPIQPALVVMALVIMIIAFIGNYFDPAVHLIGPQDIAGMVIIHPITALTAGFLVAGGLEAAGAFTAAADALGRIEKLKIKGKTVFGFTGTVVILTNIPTLIAMPCGRILGAALMPAALFFGYRVAKSTGDSRMVGVVVFAFIVNAAASCGPSPLGGIGTIGEGLSKMPIGSFTTAQSTGIMLATGVCALFMRFITPMSPADLSDEDIRREKEVENQAQAGKSDKATESKLEKNDKSDSETDKKEQKNPNPEHSKEVKLNKKS